MKKVYLLFVFLMFMTACDVTVEYDEKDVEKFIKNKLGIDNFEMQYLGLGCEVSDTEYSYIWSVHLDGKFDFYVRNKFYETKGTTFAGSKKNKLVSNYYVSKLNYLLTEYESKKLSIQKPMVSSMCSSDDFLFLSVEGVIADFDDIDELLSEVVHLDIYLENDYTIYFSVSLDKNNSIVYSTDINDFTNMNDLEKSVENMKHDVILFYLYRNVDISNYFVEEDIKNALTNTNISSKYIRDAIKEDNSNFLSLFTDEEIKLSFDNETIKKSTIISIISSQKFQFLKYFSDEEIRNSLDTINEKKAAYFSVIKAKKYELLNLFYLEDILYILNNEKLYEECLMEGSVITCPFSSILDYPNDFSKYHYFLSLEDVYGILKRVNYSVLGTKNHFNFISIFGDKYEFSDINGYIEISVNNVKTTNFIFTREEKYLDGSLIWKFLEVSSLNSVDSRVLLILTGISGDEVTMYMENKELGV